MMEKLNKALIIFIYFILLAGILNMASGYSILSLVANSSSGDISFFDTNGIPLNGVIDLTADRISNGLKENTNYISWTNVPNAKIYFNALDTKGISINLVMGGDSPKGKVMLENYGTNKPISVNTSAPRLPLKYVEISTIGVSFAEADISIKYTDTELKEVDEKTLVLYQYDSVTQAWSELPTNIDAVNNILTTSVKTLSVFAVSAKVSDQIEVRDTRKISIVSDIKIYDDKKNVKKAKRSSTLSEADIQNMGELEIDALNVKNVSIKLKNNSSSGGDIILDDYGKKNPVIASLPGKPVKYVEISTSNISFISAEITIKYSDAELEGVDESMLVIYHWNGAAWEALPTSVDSINNTLTAITTSLSPFGVSTSYGYINAIIARKVILDEPYGTGWNPESGGGNWLTGISLRQYVYIVVISNFGLPIRGANVTGSYTAANGSTNLLPFSGTTNAYGEFNTSTSLDNQVRIGQTSNNKGPNEGGWNVTINITYNNTTTSVKRDFILGEYGCGRSGTGCHIPGGGVSGKGGEMVSMPVLSHDPYISGVSVNKPEQSVHMVYSPSGTDHKAPTDTVAGRNCATCHRGYNQTGYQITNAYMNNATALSTNDLHEVNNVKCKACHGNFTSSGVVQLKYEVPQCYNSSCHANTVNLPKTWVQSKNNSYSWNQRAHNTNQTIACIFCHGPFHNTTKPNSTLTSVANGVTESENCANNCHKNQRYHNGSGGVQCTVCHSQAAHEIRYFNSTGNYTYNITQSPSGVNVGRNYSGKCSTCHQKPYFANILNNTKKPNDNYSVVNGSYSKGSSGSKLVSNPMIHSNALNNGTKWGNYWNASKDSDSCIYCHGDVYNNVGFSFTESALGHIVQFMGNNTVNSSISSSTYWCASCHWQGYTSGTKNYNDMVNSFLSDNDPVPPEITGNATYGANKSNPDYFDHSSVQKNDASCNGCHGARIADKALPTITDFMHEVSIGSSCTGCHYSWSIMNGTYNSSSKYVNVTLVNESVHAALNCKDCHANTAVHPPPKSGWKWCEDCHANQQNPQTNKSRHNIVNNPWNNIYNGISAVNITSCITCHSATLYDKSKNTYGKEKGIDCDFCHTFPDNVIG